MHDTQTHDQDHDTNRARPFIFVFFTLAQSRRDHVPRLGEAGEDLGRDSSKRGSAASVEWVEFQVPCMRH